MTVEWACSLAEAVLPQLSLTVRLQLRRRSFGLSRMNVIDVVPIVLVELIQSIPAMLLNCFSSGVATEAAIVSALAPGNVAVTEIEGKSTAGKSFTGSAK